RIPNDEELTALKLFLSLQVLLVLQKCVQLFCKRRVRLVTVGHPLFQVTYTNVDSFEGRGYRGRIELLAVYDELIRVFIHKPHRKARTWIGRRKIENVGIRG